MFGVDNLQSQSENAVRTLLNDILAPIIGYFSFINSFERFSVMQQETVRTPTNDRLHNRFVELIWALLNREFQIAIADRKFRFFF